METEIDNIVFDDDDFGVQIENEPQNQNEDDLTTEILRLKGISDPGKIKFEDETGAITERSWDSLSKDEQINILINSEESSNPDISESELELIQQIRDSGMSPTEYIQSLIPEVQEVKQYDVQDLSDEELYALDLLHKVGNEITDEEINEAIETAKKNESLFKKTVEGLRKEYIRLQEEEEINISNRKAQEKEAEYNKFANSITEQISKLDKFAGQPLQLSDEEVEDLSSFILDMDEQGLSAFGKALNNPSLFTKAAFWILNEDKIVEELNRQIQDNYKRGYEQAKLDLQGGSKPKLVFNKPASQKKTTDDVFIDDEDWF